MGISGFYNNNAPQLGPSLGSEGSIQRLQREYQHPDTADQKKLKGVAQEFEAVFFQQLLETMDKTVDREGSMLDDGYAGETFRSMMNQEVAKMATSGPAGSGFGLAENIYQQMALNLEKSDQARLLNEAKDAVTRRVDTAG